MGIYSKTGQPLSEAFARNGNSLEEAYDVDGNVIFRRQDPYIPGRQLVFEDDFDGDILNPNYWICEVGNMRNEENFFRSQNVTVENGMLILTAKREQHLNKSWTSGSITSGSDNSPNMPKWLYGRIEAKIKFPNVVGAFCAFWLVGSNSWRIFASNQDELIEKPAYGGVPWPDSGEIDILETMPGNTKRPPANLWACNNGVSLGSTPVPFDVNTGDWHVWSMEWTSEYIAVLVDDYEFKRWTFSNYQESQIAGYRLPQRILLDLAVGTQGGQPSASTNEMKMYVDWVRVYAPLT